MEQVAYIIESTKGYFRGFTAMLTPDGDDSALFVTNSTEKYPTLEEAQKQLKELPAGIKVYMNPIKSSENGLSWLSELETGNKVDKSNSRKMDKLSIQGNCGKDNWYKILDCIDQLKQEGWFIQGKTRNDDEKTGRIDFNYTLNKNIKA